MQTCVGIRHKGTGWPYECFVSFAAFSAAFLSVLRSFEIARGDGSGVERTGATVKESAKKEISAEILTREILKACEGTEVSLAAQLEIRINPNYTPSSRIARHNSPIRCVKESLQSKCQGKSHQLAV